MEKKFIICVDDEKIVLDSIKNELKNFINSDYTIEIAESADEAIEIFEEYKEKNYQIPLVISDYIMPDMKGDELLRKIKNADSSVYTIMLTGQATLEGVTNAINNAGLYRYIGKPWESKDFVLTVSEALKSYDKDCELDYRRKELELANEKLMKLDKAKSFFLGLLSHELNTPLIGINGNAKLIKELSDDKDIIESADDILASEARLRKFSDLSLLITRLQTDKYNKNFYIEDIFQVLNSTLNTYNGKISDKKIKLKSYLNNSFLVEMDVSLIHKVFEIVLDNSIKYAPVEGLIKIESFVQNNNLKLIIEDSGIGFSNSTLESIFELFTISDLMSHKEGTGLSLVAAKLIMEMHNFNIIAKNAINGGALIEMTFQN